MRLKPWILIVETILAFATPAYLWFWGLISLPIWILGAVGGDATSILYVLAIGGGVLGAIGTTICLVDLASNEPPDSVRLIGVIGLCLCGLFGIWTISTGHFEGFEINSASFLNAILPTLCTAHVLVTYARSRVTEL